MVLLQQLLAPALFLLAGLITASLARARGRSALGWFFMGTLFPGLGLFFVYRLAPVTRTCPECGGEFSVDSERWDFNLFVPGFQSGEPGPSGLVP